MNPIPKTKIIRLKGQKLAKLNETIHQRDQHKCIYCGNRVDPGEKFHHIAGRIPRPKRSGYPARIYDEFYQFLVAWVEY